jgi:Uma2 family endonuclease
VTTGLKKTLDYDDYAAIPPDGNRYEIIEGELYVTPAPSPHHQRASKRLQRMLEAFFEAGGLGEVFDAPIDLILTSHDVVQPDLVVVTDAAQVSSRAIEGPPVLVVEVLSPSTQSRDRTVKARRYAALGVRHCWILDQDARRLECYRLEAGSYALVASAEGEAALTHPDWPGLTVTLAELWR